MDSVDDIMLWKNHPYKTDNELFTVEEYNKEDTKVLGWEKTDVLYSFFGIYVVNNQYSKDERIYLYSKWLERTVGIIRKRERLLKKELKK